jgi:hypothetical protein
MKKMTTKLTPVEVPTEGSIMGRNGFFKLSAVQLFPLQHPINPTHEVQICGIGSRGTLINGGLWVTAEAMDKLANDWLKMRGKQVA